MPSIPLRKDAARNWQRIVDAGRDSIARDAPVQLNEVARAAGVGVATVYRHFPTPEALVEAVAAPGLEALAEHAERALQHDDAWAAFEDFLLAASRAAITDPSIPAVIAASGAASPATDELLGRLASRFGALLARAQAAGVVDPAVTPADIGPLMCAVAYAARVRAGDDDDADARAANARRYLSMLLQGVRTRAG